MSIRRAGGVRSIVECVKSGTYVAARLLPAARGPATPRMPSATWRIYIGEDFSIDIGEGPFTTRAAAVEFAKNEVGVAWSVRRNGATPRASDPRWVPETEEQRLRRGAKRQAQVEENRRFREAEERFRREHPEASGEEYRRFVATWSATSAAPRRGR